MMLPLSHPRSIVVAFTLLAIQPLTTDRLGAQAIEANPTKPSDLPESARWMRSLSSKASSVYVDKQRLWLVPGQPAIEEHQATLARLCAPIRSFRWLHDSDVELKFVPEPDHWVFSWKEAPLTGATIEVVFDGDPMLPEDCPAAEPAGDGSVMLLAHQAKTFGEKLRFEPQWYKNTVGYWTVPSDYATWELTIDSPGKYAVAVLQGCGEGQGGSDAVITLKQGDQRAAELPFQTIDTGHFQNFRWNPLGEILLEATGTYELRIDAKRIAKNALFDVRAIHLVKQAK